MALLKKELHLSITNILKATCLVYVVPGLNIVKRLRRIYRGISLKLYLVDSSIFIFKAWFVKNTELVNRNGEENQAFIGFSDFVYRLLTEIAPQKLVFAFDESQKKSERKTLYPEYKANRSPTPPELRRQFAWCQQWVEYLGISKVSSTEWEADDLIGSLASLHRSAELAIVILTADKDLTQLVHEGDLWWSFYDNRKLDYAGVIKKFGVKPEQIADQLALTGDKVDNIPGIPRIGNKTAANLLRKFGTLQNLRDNLDQVKKMKFRYAGQVAQSLIDNESILDISGRLTPVNCEIDNIDKIPIDRGAIQHDKLLQMMDAHAMDNPRLQKWNAFLQSN